MFIYWLRFIRNIYRSAPDLTGSYSYGLFDPRFGGHFPAGIINDGKQLKFNLEEIQESITYAWYERVESETRPTPEKTIAYSWVKAPRYHGLSFEGGPLARKIIRTGNVTSGTIAIGAMARLVARAEEAELIATWMEDWMKQLPANGQYIIPLGIPDKNQAIQINDAPRGPLLHSITAMNEEVSSYHIISPSTWNFSPKDETGGRGPVEEALIGAIVDPINPVEPGRIIRSFDPCLTCATHFIDWEGQNKLILSCV